MTPATTPKPKRKRSKKTPIPALHPAKVAIAAEHATMAGWPAGTGSCFLSDLAHDFAAIDRHPDQAFAWMLSPHGTHMIRVGEHADTFADAQCIARGALASGVQILTSLVDYFAPEALNEGWLKLYLWDGSRLHRATNHEDLQRLYKNATLHTAITGLQFKRIPLVEDLAYVREAHGAGLGAISYEGARAIATAQRKVTEIDEDIARLNEACS